MCSRRYESSAPQLPPPLYGNVDGIDAAVDDSVDEVDADVDGSVDGADVGVGESDVDDCHRGVTSFSSSAVM